MQVLRLPKTGGGTPQPAPIPALVFSGAEAYWLNGNGDVMQSAKDGSLAVVLVSGSDIAKIGGAPPGFHTSHTVTGIYPIGKDVFLTVFVNMHAGSIGCSDMVTFLLKIPKTGGPFTVLATVMDESDGLVSEPFVYWTGSHCTGLIKGSLNSSAKLELDQSNAYRKLADDMDYVYWTDANLGTVNAISK